MLRNLARLGRYRGLIQSLVARELKARYRGSVLGFFWSFFNPLLLLLVYSIVFKYVMTAAHDPRVEPYGLFMFCGLLPWTWFSSSLSESAGVLISGGNLIKKVLFPAEILPIVTVLANMVHFFLGLPILIAFLIYYQRSVSVTEILWFPVIVGRNQTRKASRIGSPKKKCIMFESTATIGRISAGNRTFLIRFPPEINTPDDSSNDDENQVHGRMPQNMNSAYGSISGGCVPGSTTVKTKE